MKNHYFLAKIFVVVAELHFVAKKNKKIFEWE